MKKVLFLLAGIAISLNGYSQKSNYKVFPFKTAVIEYKQEGSSTGTRTTYIDDYGYKQAEYIKTTMKVFGQTVETDGAEIIIGPDVYGVDYKSNTLTKMENPVYKTYANSEGKDYEQLGKEALESLGFSKTGETGTVLGKKCEIWKGNIGELWIWNVLALKTKTNVMGVEITETVVKIDLNASVPAEKFDIPKNMKVEEVEVPENMDELMKNFMNGENK